MIEYSNIRVGKMVRSLVGGTQTSKGQVYTISETTDPTDYRRREFNLRLAGVPGYFSSDYFRYNFEEVTQKDIKKGDVVVVLDLGAYKGCIGTVTNITEALYASIEVSFGSGKTNFFTPNSLAIITNSNTLVGEYRVRVEGLRQQNEGLRCKIDAMKTAVKKVLDM